MSAYKKLEKLLKKDEDEYLGFTKTQVLNKELNTIKPLLKKMLESDYPITKILINIQAAGISIKKHQTLSKRLKKMFPEFFNDDQLSSFNIVKNKDDKDNKDNEVKSIKENATKNNITNITIKQTRKKITKEEFKESIFNIASINSPILLNNTNNNPSNYFNKILECADPVKGGLIIAREKSKWSKDLGSEVENIAKLFVAAKSNLNTEEVKAFTTLVKTVGERDFKNIILPF